MSGISGAEEAMLADTVRRFVRREIWLWEKRIDANAFALPAEVAVDLGSKVAAMGLSLVREAEALGGPGPDGPALDGRARALVVEEMSQHRAGALSPGYGLFGPAVPPALYAANAEQAARFLLPLLQGERVCFVGLDDPWRAAPAGVRGAPGVRIRARQTASGWMLDGTKLFVAGAGAVDAGEGFGVVYARTESTAGEGLGVSCFVVETDRPGFQRWRPYPTLAVGRDTQELNLSNLRLPAENLLGGVGEGLGLARGARARRDVFVAAGVVGGGAGGAGDSAERARGGEAGESRRWAVADGQALVAGARALVRTAADPAWEEQGEDKEDAGAAEATAAQARLAALVAAGRVVDGAMTALGPAGLSADVPLERWFRELRVVRESDGGRRRLREVSAGQLLATYGR